MASRRYKRWLKGVGIFVACVVLGALLRPLAKGLMGMAVDAAIAVALAAVAFLIVRANLRRRTRARAGEECTERLHKARICIAEAPAQPGPAVEDAQPAPQAPAEEKEPPRTLDKAARVEAELERLRKALFQERERN